MINPTGTGLADPHDTARRSIREVQVAGALALADLLRRDMPCLSWRLDVRDPDESCGTVTAELSGLAGRWNYPADRDRRRALSSWRAILGPVTVEKIRDENGAGCVTIVGGYLAARVEVWAAFTEEEFAAIEHEGWTP